jgi:hypothetical protein
MHVFVDGRRAEIFNASEELIAPTESDRGVERRLHKSVASILDATTAHFPGYR